VPQPQPPEVAARAGYRGWAGAEFEAAVVEEARRRIRWTPRDWALFVVAVAAGHLIGMGVSSLAAELSASWHGPTAASAEAAPMRSPAGSWVNVPPLAGRPPAFLVSADAGAGSP
jgi:hypothetical protein